MLHEISSNMIHVVFLLFIKFHNSIATDHDLIGWTGESHHVATQRTSGQKENGKSQALDYSKVEQISWKPRAWVVRDLLTEEECDHLVHMSEHRLQRSGVVDVENGGPVESNIRTSQGTFLSRGGDEIIKRVEDKIAQWSMIPKENGEGLQVLKYQEGQEYKAHFDYFFHKEGINNGGNRMATVLLYLNTPEFGGETVFPLGTQPKDTRSLSPCGSAGLGVRPQKGDALLFFSLKPNGVLDQFSKHAGCPVLRGEKWTATKWMHVAPFSMGIGRPQRVEHVIHAPPPRKPTETCFDENAKFCEGWAEQGECVSNPGYMKASCKMACNLC